MRLRILCILLLPGILLTAWPVPGKPATMPASGSGIDSLKHHVAEATSAVEKARADCLQQLAAAPDYQAAEKEEAAASKALDEARASGTPEDKLQASAAFNRARSAVEGMRTTALKKSAALTQAQQTLADAQAGLAAASAPASLFEYTRGDRVVLVIDNGAGLSDRIADVRRAMLAVLDSLQADQKFTVVVADDQGPLLFQSGLVPASKEMRDKSLSFVDRKPPKNPTPFADLAAAAAKLKPDLIWVVSEGDFAGAKDLFPRVRGVLSRSNAHLSTTTLLAGTPAAPPSYDRLRNLWRLAHENAGVCIGSHGVPLEAPKAPADSSDHSIFDVK